MIVFVVFCRDAFSRDAAERFGGLTGLLKRNTASLVEAGKVFSD
jgi:hypothetical protein